jgi:hypothetical protein
MSYQLSSRYLIDISSSAAAAEILGTTSYGEVTCGVSFAPHRKWFAMSGAVNCHYIKRLPLLSLVLPIYLWFK